MCYLIFLFAGNIGGRVTEEKASRVVEIILATIRPQDLLIGKIIANTIVGCVASGIILAASTIALRISGIMSSTVQAIYLIPIFAFLISNFYSQFSLFSPHIPT
ncbi:hypothetical protein EML15_04830 [Corynebacterium sp. sy017]|uniref:ABC transporter permease n=1 Tax=Corynebacterium sp. SY003 TaxID=2499164 RepID=UPI001186382E|nr:hypothetical protein [Corynebacterium sp. sy017]TSD91779.1 hypothetical protein ELY17_04830 [Corynebacterium sp. SY003]